jgi:biopolymer transport protein ExbD
MEFERRRRNHTHLNIAPLVDVVFLLLLFFMLTSHFIQEPAINIRLPESRTAEVREEKVMTVLITRDGEIYFMEERVGLKGLPIALKGYFHDSEKGSLRIKTDREVDVGLLVEVIDEVRLAGVRNFSIVTKRK